MYEYHEKLKKREINERRSVQGKYSEEIKWYCVMTHFLKEKNVGAAIQKMFSSPGCVEVLVPIAGNESPDPPKKDVAGKLLFNGCVFVRCLMTEEIYMGIISCKGVFSILGDAFRIPQVMDGREMAALKELLNFVPAPMLADWPKSGAKAVVTSGKLKGLEGRIFERHDAYPKVAFRFSFIGAESAVVVMLSRDQVRIESASGGGKDLAARE